MSKAFRLWRGTLRSALGDLALDHLYVLDPGTRTYPLDRRVTAPAFARAATALKRLR
jgi:hypothetical protein